ncbi:tRNA (adenosine(37)-N6)-dimethylallyltransferase MiaA [Olsenella intestinalis]|uniref:tRNA (adenosine(37)-N6)-dimethylallyltransferase MiaA n=1 Tax=Olsenella intestinalis TaxID=2930083 RepID=UPI00200EB671|nr:tRNA (adenosine(37)-N6)-dimethylallyltransferase MiaA [Olsenella intestinalis]
MSKAGHVVCIVGPTASGKSSLAERLAVTLGSAVVSVDAMQVYRGMDIGTAKTPVDERACELMMVDVCDVGDDYSVRLFQRDARACVDALLASERTPVLCGGTGLYLDAVIDEMDFPAGQTGSEARERYEAIARDEGAIALHELLRGRDPKSAELIHPNNVRRVVRALEMLDEGVSYAAKHEGLRARRPHYDALLFGITMDRERLYKRINVRVDAMVEAGLVDEVRALAEGGLAETLTAMQAIGYKEVVAYLDGALTLDEAIDEVKRRSRRYAKRQLSWLRRDGRVRWLDYDRLDEDEAARIVLAALDGQEV